SQNVANGAGSRYHFSAWSGASTATTLSTSVTMSAPRSLTANYQLQYQLSLATATNPATSPSAVALSNVSGASDGDWFDSGTPVTLTATQNVANGAGSRYHFSAWSGASTATTLSTSVTMSAPRSLTANYQLQYQLSLATAT